MNWFKYLNRGYCESVKFHWLLQWKLTDSTVKNISKSTDLIVENILSTGVSVKMQITDSISENLTNSDLESREKYKPTILFQWSEFSTMSGTFICITKAMYTFDIYPI